MTMIASFLASGTPVIIADLSIFTSAFSSKFRRPGTGKNSKVPETNFQPIFLRQKVIRFRPNFALAFAGDTKAVTKLIRAIRKTLNTSGVDLNGLASIEHLEAAKAKMSFRELTNAHYVGFISRTPVSMNALQIIASGYDKLTVAGSGYKHMEEIGSGFDYIFSKGQPKDSIAMHKGLMTIAHFWALDSDTEINFQSSFGGGYQILVYQENVFRYVDDYMLLTAISLDLNEIGYPAKVAKFDYVDNVLFLRVLEIQKSAGLHSTDIRRYAAPTIDDPLDRRRLIQIQELGTHIPDMNANHAGVGLKIFDGEKFQINTLSKTTDDRKNLIYFENEGKVLHLTKEFIEESIDIVKYHRQLRGLPDL